MIKQIPINVHANASAVVVADTAPRHIAQNAAVTNTKLMMMRKGLVLCPIFAPLVEVWLQNSGGGSSIIDLLVGGALQLDGVLDQ